MRHVVFGCAMVTFLVVQITDILLLRCGIFMPGHRTPKRRRYVSPRVGISTGMGFGMGSVRRSGILNLSPYLGRKYLSLFGSNLS